MMKNIECLLEKYLSTFKKVLTELGRGLENALYSPIASSSAFTVTAFNLSDACRFRRNISDFTI